MPILCEICFTACNRKSFIDSPADDIFIIFAYGSEMSYKDSLGISIFLIKGVIEIFIFVIQTWRFIMQ